MAVPANTTETYNRVGIREDLTDILENISPTDVPFMSNIGKTTAKGTFHEWQTDELEAAADTPVVEGDDATADLADSTVRVGNYTQIARKTVSVSGSNKVSDNAGRGEEMAYQVAKRGKEIKRDMETSMIGTNKGRVAGSTGVARELGSIHSWIASNTNSAGDATESNGDGTNARTDGTVRTFDEAFLEDAIDQNYSAGGDANILMSNTKQRRKITGFTGNAQKEKDVKDKTVVNAVSVYITDYGDLTVVANRFMRQTEAFLLESDKFATAFYRPFMIEDLAKTGDNDKKMLITEFTLVSKEEKASAAIYDLDPA